MLASKYADPLAAAQKSSPPTFASSDEDKPLPPVPKTEGDQVIPQTTSLIDTTENVNSSGSQNFDAETGTPPSDQARVPVKQSAAQDLQGLKPSRNTVHKKEDLLANGEAQMSGGSQEPIASVNAALRHPPITQQFVGAAEMPTIEDPAELQSSVPKEASSVDPGRLGVSPTPEFIKRIGSPANMGIKKRISRTGKPCVIRIPFGSVHSRREHMPMTASEVKAKLEAFIEEGHSVRGFDLAQSTEESSQDELHFENQQLFPKPAVISGNSESFEVCIPDQRKWDAYVNQMTEEKLKALGVTTAEDEAAPTAGSRTDSPFGSLATSPPPLTSSAASQQKWRNSLPFSGRFSPNTATDVTSLDAIASPVSSSRQPGRHGQLSRQSTASFPLSPPYVHDTARTQSTSPLNGGLAQPQARGSFAAMAGQLSRQASALSQSSVNLHRESPRLDDNFENKTPKRTSSSGAAARKPSSMSDHWSTANIQARNEKEEDLGYNRATSAGDPPVYGFNGNLAYPTPRGHRQNISESLEREAESAQYYPGEFVEKSTPSLPRSINEPRSDDPASQTPSVQAGAAQTNGHRARPSVASNTSSHLNVEAAEFKFGGSGSQASKFTVPKNAFVPGLSGSNDPTKPHLSLLTAHANGEATGGTDFNAAAPVFRPAPQSNFGFTSAFDFTAKAPTISDAKSKKASVDLSSNKQAENETRPGLFSRILSDVIKPSKKSKAIPIMNPNNLPNKQEQDESDEEDEFGRPTQNKGRVKRGRLHASDEDAVPQFAMPSTKPYVPPQRRFEQEVPLEPELDTLDPGTENDDDGAPWHDLDFASQPEKSLLREFNKTPPLPAKSPARASPAIRDLREPRPDLLKSPTYQEIDAIMEHLNNSDHESGESGMQHDIPQFPAPPGDEVNRNKIEDSPLEASQTSLPRNASNPSARVPTDWLQEQLDLRTSQSPVRKLNNVDDAPVSDWDDMLSVGEENTILPQAQFFDTRVKSLIESVLKQHLSPLQQHVKDVGASVEKLSERETSARRRVSGYEKSSSDADDEEETEVDRDPQPRPVSRKSNNRMDQIKAAVLSAMAAAPVKEHEPDSKDGVEAAQSARDVQKLLDISEKEIAIYKESTEDLENRIKTFESERQASTQRVSNLERIERELKGKTSDMSREIHALEGTLNEFRTSSTKWRQEIDSVKQARESMTATIERLREEANESIKTREVMSEKIVKMQEASAIKLEKFNQEREKWRLKDEQQSKETAVLGSRMSEELRLRTKLEEDVERSAEAEKAAVRAHVTVEELGKTNTHLTEDVARLRADNMNLQNTAALHDREAREAKDIARAEIQRSQTLLEADVEVAKKKTESVRTDLDMRLQLTREELDRARDELEATSAGHKRALERASEARGTAIRQATEASQAAFAEERKRFEHSLRELSQQHDKALNGLSQEHEKSKREMSQHHDRGMHEMSERKDYERREALQQKDRQMRDVAQQKDREIREIRQSSEQHTRTNREVSEQKDRQMREVIQEADRTKKEASQDAERRVRDVVDKHKADRHERSEKHKQALRDQFEKHEQVMRETLEKHEKHKEEMTEQREQVMTELTQQHERTLKNAREDKSRSETHHDKMHSVSKERIANLEERNRHLDDRIVHLEDKVTVAQSAAQAAALAAQQSSKQPAAHVPDTGEPTSKAVAHPGPHDRVSPQALRESIVVLQEQLQERETRIERLESQFHSVDKDAPAKVAARETEIGWLRELLGVRVDDLTELVKTLSTEDAQYDKSACRDAAIRIKANLQMEQQVRERLISGGSTTPGIPGLSGAARPLPLPTFSDIQSFASPKAAQLAAAWGNWRKGGQSPSVSGLRDALRPSSSTSSTVVDPDATPSRNSTTSAMNSSAATAQTFLTGLMTPPASNLRRTPSTTTPTQRNTDQGEEPREDDDYDDDIDPDTRPLSLQLGDELDSAAGSTVSANSPIRSRMSSNKSAESSPRKDKSRTGSGTSRSKAKPQARPGMRETVEGPVTPPLMRKGSYNMRARGTAQPGEEDAVEGTLKATDLEPFGGVMGGGAGEKEQMVWSEER
ncbi:MAG: hypothetical protein M1828_006505 [Chrysothrix sp. TS-e1954]|nr:MAG: hypothetical protein M1828_006505 [Chrysothrix sp. TS-e1954]